MFEKWLNKLTKKKAERETDAKEQQKGSTTEDHTNTETSDSMKEISDSKKKASSVDDYDNEVVYEAELELTVLERSKNTTRKLKCIGILIVIMATILFIFSFPFSLFLVLFCFNTK